MENRNFKVKFNGDCVDKRILEDLTSKTIYRFFLCEKEMEKSNFKVKFNSDYLVERILRDLTNRTIDRFLFWCRKFDILKILEEIFG